MKVTNRTRHPELSVAAYHALPLPQHLNFSTLRRYAADGPWRCYWDIIWPQLPHKELEEALSMMLPDASDPPPVDDDDTDARRVGRLFHLAMEKDNWQDEVVCMPTCLIDGAAYETMKDEFWDYNGTASLSLSAELNSRTKPHQRYKELFQEQATAEGKEWMSEKDKRLVFSQVEACLANQAVRP